MNEVDVVTEIVIESPRSEVASYAANPENAPEWYVNIASAKWLTSPPLATGSRIAFVANFLGRTLRYTYEVTAFEPGIRLVMRTHEGPFPMETTYEWTDAAAGATHMMLRNRGTPSGFTRVFAWFMTAAMRRANRADLARLKQLLESRLPNGS